MEHESAVAGLEGMPLLESRIPDDHPHKHDVEGALRTLLESYGGAWRCRVDVSPNGRGWSLRLFNVVDRSCLVLVARPELQAASTLVGWLGHVLDRRRGAVRDPAAERRAQRSA